MRTELDIRRQVDRIDLALQLGDAVTAGSRFERAVATTEPARALSPAKVVLRPLELVNELPALCDLRLGIASASVLNGSADFFDLPDGVYDARLVGLGLSSEIASGVVINGGVGSAQLRRLDREPYRMRLWIDENGRFMPYVGPADVLINVGGSLVTDAEVVTDAAGWFTADLRAGVDIRIRPTIFGSDGPPSGWRILSDAVTPADDNELVVVQGRWNLTLQTDDPSLAGQSIIAYDGVDATGGVIDRTGEVRLQLKPGDYKLSSGESIVDPERIKVGNGPAVAKVQMLSYELPPTQHGAVQVELLVPANEEFLGQVVLRGLDLVTSLPADGTVAFGPLVAGSYEVRMDGHPTLDGLVEFDIKAGEVTSVVLPCAPGPRSMWTIDVPDAFGVTVRTTESEASIDDVNAPIPVKPGGPARLVLATPDGQLLSPTRPSEGNQTFTYNFDGEIEVDSLVLLVAPDGWCHEVRRGIARVRLGTVDVYRRSADGIVRQRVTLAQGERLRADAPGEIVTAADVAQLISVR